MGIINLKDELHQNFIDYGYEVNSQRSFPDVRDGLKPSQRACLWEMYTKGYNSKKPHVKSAKISGGVVASWHPHSDSAAYETFTRMSQSWINNIPEVDWHGSNGNVVIGPEAAASRYTEARLSKAAEDGLFQGLKKKNVPMILNFSEDEEWPEVFPALMPRLLVNGSMGIGVTIANTWLNMNLKEIVEVINEYLKTGLVNTNKFLIDFPSGGIIINSKDLHNIHEIGKGKVILRATTEIKGNSIFIYELPYQIYVESLLNEIKSLIEKDQITGIRDCYNKSDKKRLLIEIECENNINPENVLNQLFKLTDLEKTYNANQWGLVDKTPQLLNLKQYLDIYIKHNLVCIKKEYEYDLKKAKERLEIVHGLLKALEIIDQIIQLIKNSKDSAIAKDNLINQYNFSELQAKAIIEMKLGKLSNLEQITLSNEEKELINSIKDWEDIISKEERLKEIFLNRLNDFTLKYGNERRTKLLDIEESKNKKDLIPFEEFQLSIFKDGSAKRTNIRAQKRGGKGVKSDANLVNIIDTNSYETLNIFTAKGKIYRVQAREGLLVSLNEGDKIVYVISEQENVDKYVFLTKQGMIKKTKADEYTGAKSKRGIVAIKLKENDEIVSVYDETKMYSEDNTVVVATKKGMGIQFYEKEIPTTGRNTIGVHAIKLENGDEVIGCAQDHPDVAIFTKSGYGKKIKWNEIPIQTRGGKGVLIVPKGENISKIYDVSLENTIVNYNNGSKMIFIKANELPLLGRTALGVKIIG